MNYIKGTTKVCGIIGNPVAHSISPTLHNTLTALQGIDLVYVPFCVEEERLGDAIRGAYAMNICGLNVTVPHKSAVLKELKEVDDLAAAIGAVNTLVRVDGGYKGYNTDIIGLKRELEEEGIPLRNQEIIIIGAGGAARAIAFLCASEGAKHIYLLNRTVSRAENIAKAVNERFGNVVIPMALEQYADIPGTGLIAIQTTSVGLYPNVDAAPIEDRAFYDKIAAGVDIIYNPARTKFMKLILQSRGEGIGGTCKCAYHGLKMLLYQGISAYELWNDCIVDQRTAIAVYEQMKREMNIC